MLSKAGIPVDVPDDKVREKMGEGWVIDPNPDRRGQLHGATPGKHKGEVALVVASGPSTGLVGAERIRDFALDHAAVVYGVNEAWRICDGRPLPMCDYLCCLDDHSWRDWWLHQGLKTFVESTGALQLLGFDPPFPGVDYQRIPINTAALPGTNPPYKPNAYFHGLSSGVAACQHALHCGFETVYLLGHDLCGYGGKTHGHGARAGYNGQYGQGREMFEGYRVLRDHAVGLGVELVNLSPISSLQGMLTQGDI
jgi:hypothetical protein